MGTRIGGFIGFSTAASSVAATGMWTADQQSYFMRKGNAFWPSGESFGPLTATGGSIEVPGNGYKYHYFTSSGSFNVSAGTGDGVVYIIGGGGGGAFSQGGGGGAGGMRSVPVTINAGIVAITIGAGAANAEGSDTGSISPTTGRGLVGSATTLTSSNVNNPLHGIYASGGGGGISAASPSTYAMGGSGGGDSSYRVVETNPGTSGSPGLTSNAGNLGGFTPPEGNRGGWTNPGSIAPNYGGSGGGGAGGVGGAGSPSTGGAGGVGAAFADPAIAPTYGTPGPDGALRYFAAGGGGGTYLSGTTPEQYGGGGMGGARATIGATHNPQQDGDTNTGSGGGGLGDNVGGTPHCGTGKGGSGFVCIRYPV